MSIKGSICNLVISVIVTSSKNGYAAIDVPPSEPLPAVRFGINTSEFFKFESFCENAHSFKNTDIEILMRTEQMNKEKKREMLEICKEYSNIFFKTGDNSIFTSKVKHQIRTTDDIFIHSKSYRNPYVHKNEVRSQFEEMLGNKIIRPSLAHSPPLCGSSRKKLTHQVSRSGDK